MKVRIAKDAYDAALPWTVYVDDDLVASFRSHDLALWMARQLDNETRQLRLAIAKRIIGEMLTRSQEHDKVIDTTQTKESNDDDLHGSCERAFDSPQLQSREREAGSDAGA